MTRTARAAYPRAVNKDRSEPRTGLYDPARKDGGGQHNWGKLSDEEELEKAALTDIAYDETEESEAEAEAAGAPPAPHRRPSKCRPSRRRMARMVKLPISSEELLEARRFRKKAGKNLRAARTEELDLTAIARTSAAVLPKEEGAAIHPIVPGYKPAAGAFPTFALPSPSLASPSPTLAE